MKKDDMLSLMLVDMSVNGEMWKEVETFENHDSDDPVFTFDPATGTVVFGDGVHGRRPPTGSTISATYQSGAGSAGNIVAITCSATYTHLHSALLATITTSPHSFRLGICQGMEQSWRWRLVSWLCNGLRVG